MKQENTKHLNPLFENPKSQAVIGFLVAKGFLHSNKIFPKPNTKIKTCDVLWVAEHVEPRVYEVLPAAIIHFPRTFIQIDQLPQELKNIIDAIRRGEEAFSNYNGIEYKKMRHWANKQLLDKRSKPVSAHRINKTYRLNPEIVQLIKDKSSMLGMKETHFIEHLIRKYS